MSPIGDLDFEAKADMLLVFVGSTLLSQQPHPVHNPLFCALVYINNDWCVVSFLCAALPRNMSYSHENPPAFTSLVCVICLWRSVVAVRATLDMYCIVLWRPLSPEHCEKCLLWLRALFQTSARRCCCRPRRATSDSRLRNCCFLTVGLTTVLCKYSDTLFLSTVTLVQVASFSLERVSCYTPPCAPPQWESRRLLFWLISPEL